MATLNGHLKWDHGLRRQTIVQSILTEVFQGRLRPGDHLVTQELAERFRVSHTPIREALIALAGIGIIDLLPNRGALVRRVTPADVKEICQVREILECQATRLACNRIPTAGLRSLEADLKKSMCVRAGAEALFIERAQELDSRLHDSIADHCGNRFLGAELNRLKILFRSFRDVAWQHDEAHHDFRRLSQEAHQHLAIVVALLAGDSREATRAMARHIRSGYKYWSRALPEMAAHSPRRRPLSPSLRSPSMTEK